MSEDQSSSEPRSIDDASGTESFPPKQRRYRKAYKLRLIELADACTAPSELASLLLKEDVHSSTLAEFRRQKARGILEPNSDKVAGAKASVHDSPLLKPLAAADQEVRRLRRELEKAQVLLDLQKKVADLMRISLDRE